MSNNSIRSQGRPLTLLDVRAEFVLYYIGTSKDRVYLCSVYHQLEEMELSREAIDTAVVELIRKGRLEVRGDSCGVYVSPAPEEWGPW